MSVRTHAGRGRFACAAKTGESLLSKRAGAAASRVLCSRAKTRQLKSGLAPHAQDVNAAIDLENVAASFTVEGPPCERGLDVLPVEREGFGLSRKTRVKPALVEQEASSGLASYGGMGRASSRRGGMAHYKLHRRKR